jgi:hypothetical protein
MSSDGSGGLQAGVVAQAVATKTDTRGQNIFRSTKEQPDSKTRADHADTNVEVRERLDTVADGLKQGALTTTEGARIVNQSLLLVNLAPKWALRNSKRI